MNTLFKCLFIISLAMLFNISHISANNNSKESIQLILLDELRSGRAVKNDRVDFKVNEDVFSENGELMIKRGTMVYGKVIRSRRAGILGLRGILEIELNYTTTVDGRRVELIGNEVKSGNRNKRLITTSAWLVAPLIAFVRGNNVVLKAGTNIIVKIDKYFN
ncbi:MAG: hypothetical protein COB02_13535 [Candidatus Cloacimonadota bacterium]|nr:MAG: hypothetical protein COB02_13535 [Candidatus Cloacimonadota bacterium]